MCRSIASGRTDFRCQHSSMVGSNGPLLRHATFQLLAIIVVIAVASREGRPFSTLPRKLQTANSAKTSLRSPLGSRTGVVGPVDSLDVTSRVAEALILAALGSVRESERADDVASHPGFLAEGQQAWDGRAG